MGEENLRSSKVHSFSARCCSTDVFVYVLPLAKWDIVNSFPELKKLLLEKFRLKQEWLKKRQSEVAMVIQKIHSQSQQIPKEIQERKESTKTKHQKTSSWTKSPKGSPPKSHRLTNSVKFLPKSKKPKASKGNSENKSEAETEIGVFLGHKELRMTFSEFTSGQMKTMPKKTSHSSKALRASETENSDSDSNERESGLILPKFVNETRNIEQRTKGLVKIQNKKKEEKNEASRVAATMALLSRQEDHPDSLHRELLESDKIFQHLRRKGAGIDSRTSRIKEYLSAIYDKKKSMESLLNKQRMSQREERVIQPEEKSQNKEPVAFSTRIAPFLERQSEISSTSPRNSKLQRQEEEKATNNFLGQTGGTLNSDRNSLRPFATRLSVPFVITPPKLNSIPKKSQTMKSEFEKASSLANAVEQERKASFFGLEFYQKDLLSPHSSHLQILGGSEKMIPLLQEKTTLVEETLSHPIDMGKKRFYKSFFSQDPEQLVYPSPSHQKPATDTKITFHRKMVKTHHHQFRRESVASHLNFLYKKK